MNEIFDKLLIRILLAVIVLGCLVVYRYLHAIFFGHVRNKIYRRYLPTNNPAETLHFFAHIIGISLVFSQLSFDAGKSFGLSLTLFTISALEAFILFLLSSWVMVNITLYSFDYEDEILRRKNYAFALVHFFQTIGCALLVRQTLFQTGGSTLLFALVWLLAIVILGLATRVYPIVSTLNFNALITQKNLALGVSYGGYFLGVTTVIATSLDQEINDVVSYLLMVLAKFILSWIIFPIFRQGLVYIFGLKRLVGPLLSKSATGAIQDTHAPDLGHGVFEGGLFFASFYLTNMVLSRISFGNFYPTF